MPDWIYQTIFRPALTRLGDDRGRQLALGAMGRLARIPGGRRVGAGGIFSFFSFLGFGYFDPFHAFVTAILFQFLLLMMATHLAARSAMAPPGLHNDWRWRWNQWGQLLFVVQGTALLIAGVVISCIGYNVGLRFGRPGVHANDRRGTRRRPSAVDSVGGS